MALFPSRTQEGYWPEGSEEQRGQSYTAAEEDFLRRNPGDEARMAAALGNVTSNRRFDSQDTTKYDTLGNFIGSAQPSRAAAPARSYNFTPFTEQFQYSPFAEQFQFEKFNERFAPKTAAPADLMERWTRDFRAPTADEAAQSPGWQFRLNEATKAHDRAAAAQGTLLTGGTAKALERYGQDYASNEYDKVYGRNLGEYLNAFNIWGSDKARRSDEYSKQYGREASEFDRRYGQHMGTQQALQGAWQDRGQQHLANQSGLQGAWANRAQQHMANQQGQFEAERAGRMDDFTIGSFYDQMGEQGRQFDTSMGENRRQFAAGTRRYGQDFGENRRR